MTSTVPQLFEPMVIHRSSPYGKRRSEAVNETRSKTSVASVKVTPCFSLLISSLTRSHSNPTRNTIHYVYTPEKVFVSMSNRRILTPHEARSGVGSWDRCIENGYRRWRSGAHFAALRGTSACSPDHRWAWAFIFRRLRLRPFRRARVHTGRKSNDNFGASSGRSGDGPSGGKRRHLCVVGHGGQE